MAPEQGVTPRCGGLPNERIKRPSIKNDVQTEASPMSGGRLLSCGAAALTFCGVSCPTTYALFLRN